MKKQNLLLILAMALLAGMAFVGCNSDDGDGRTINPGDGDTDSDSDGDSDSDSDGDSDSDSDGDSDSDSDTDSDSDGDIGSECDGTDVDCYSGCWGCALQTPCASTVEACLADSSCSAYYQCKEDVCCNGNNDCLTGTDWEECMANCANSTSATTAALDLYKDIDKCVACDACSYSCGVVEKADFAMCADAGDVNCPTCPCYAEQATGDETACFSWAGWGGPCDSARAACKNNSDCSDLETCINDSWASDDWASIQTQCFSDYASVEQLYWDYLQCIYCDACDLACAQDASSKHCDEYTGK
ncbi:MAG: hypothetical protein JXX29_21825 [Deltaproteobacteria bacterium]|nr:hypothetical protein [Deltaproteobacteria bacterium]MBN2674334.1 hypothetical protein [Deltaproteobacteria bacterium]